MGFTDFSSDAGLDREIEEGMVMETLLTDFRVKYLAHYTELYRWVSFLILNCLILCTAFNIPIMMRNILVRVYDAA